jgi:integrase/recombinase XerD
MKDRKARSIVLTQRLTEPLQQYLGEYRPVLLGNHASQYLWIGANGRPLSKENMAGRLRKVTRDLLGVSLTPHAFRHVAATSVAEYDPEHVGIIRDILGHATLDMAGRYYNRARQVDACNGLQDLARRLKQGK